MPGSGRVEARYGDDEPHTMTGAAVMDESIRRNGMPRRRRARAGHRPGHIGGMLRALLTLALVAAGCSPAGTPGPTGSPSAAASATSGSSVSPSDAPSATPLGSSLIGYATGPTDLVLRADLGGGLLPPMVGLTDLPDVSIYGDGRVVWLISDEPGPAGPVLPSLVAAQVTPDAMQRILAAAADAGVLGPDRHYELPAVADLWTVWFTATTDGAIHRVSAYGLGFSDEERFAPAEDMEARRRLDALFDRLLDLRAWLPAESIAADAPYAPAATRVFVSRAIDPTTGGGGSTPAPATARAGQDVREWPLADPPGSYGVALGRFAEGWRCAVAGADEVATLGLATATWDTRWRAAGVLYQVVARPLLPDEAGCPAE